MKPLFCPNCHKRVIPPSFLKQANIQGNISLRCGDNKCKGILKIKNKKQEKNEETTINQNYTGETIN